VFSREIVPPHQRTLAEVLAEVVVVGQAQVERLVGTAAGSLLVGPEDGTAHWALLSQLEQLEVAQTHLKPAQTELPYRCWAVL